MHFFFAPKMNRGCPDRHFAILGPREQKMGEFYARQERRAQDFDAPKLWKGRSGFFGIVYTNIISPYADQIFLIVLSKANCS